MKKIFSKNLNSRICLKVGSDYPRGTYENVIYHFHGTIQIIITSYLGPLWAYCRTRQHLIGCYIKSCHLIGQYQWQSEHSQFSCSSNVTSELLLVEFAHFAIPLYRLHCFERLSGPNQDKHGQKIFVRNSCKKITPVPKLWMSLFPVILNFFSVTP